MLCLSLGKLTSFALGLGSLDKQVYAQKKYKYEKNSTNQNRSILQLHIFTATFVIDATKLLI